MTNEEGQLARNGSERKPIKKSKQRHMVRITYLCCHSNSPQFLTVFSFSVYTSKIKDLTYTIIPSWWLKVLLTKQWLVTYFSFTEHWLDGHSTITQTSFFIEDRSRIIINMKYLMHTPIWVRYQQCRMNEIVPL